jgi:DNA repair exonuclease SbcCD ATPase subunit
MAQGQAMQMVQLKAESELSPTENTAGLMAAGIDGAAPDQGSANIEKIRDILFGVQMREYESRFARLEENLLKEAADLRENTRKRFDAMETYLRNEFESLQARLRSEREERANSLRQLSRSMEEIQSALTTKISDLDEQTSQTDRQLRLELLEQSKNFNEDLRHKQEETAALLERRVQELRKGKTDRATLATLFNELAMRLNDELHVPGAEN